MRIGIIYNKDHAYERNIKYITILTKENTALKGLYRIKQYNSFYKSKKSETFSF